MEDFAASQAMLLDHARRTGLVIMAGAGVSAALPTSLPGWHALNRMILQALCDQVAGDLSTSRKDAIESLRGLIDNRRKEEKFPPDYQAQILEEMCGDRYFRAILSLGVVQALNEGHRRIAWLAKHGVVRAIVTTNFDQLIERALDDEGVRYQVGFDPDSYDACSTSLKERSENAESPKHGMPLLKVHGSLQDHRSLVDTLKQRLSGRNAKLEICLDRLFERHHWVVLGFSADDLDGDANYLRFVPSASRCPGLTYVQWPGAKELSKGAAKLMHAYAGKNTAPIAECNDFLEHLGSALELSPMSTRPIIEYSQDSAALVEVELKRWAGDLKPIAAVNCLASLAEANGASELAFHLAHSYWDDPRDRMSADFSSLRALHGRLGMAQGLLSFTDENASSSRHEESFQNLLRVAVLDGDPRGYVWGALAYMWAGEQKQALSLLQQGDPNATYSPAQTVDVFLAMCEFFFIVCTPEGVFKEWPRYVAFAGKSGDLPRQSRVVAIAALFYADFAPDKFQHIMALGPVQDVLARAERLNDPVVRGFLQLARGRYAVKNEDGETALRELGDATFSFAAAARPAWKLFAHIECTKALLDLKRVEEAQTLIRSIDEVIDRHQVWLPWHYEAVGQFNQCLKQIEEAHAAFRSGIAHAERFGLERMAAKLRRYLPEQGEPPETCT